MLIKFIRRKLKTTPRTKRTIGWIMLGLAIMATFAWRIKSLPPAFAEQEILNFDLVLNNKLFSPELMAGYPYYVVLKTILRFTHDVLVIRILSLALSGLGLMLFYRLCREWWSRTVAISSTAILGTSYWFLLLARLADYQCLTLLVFCLLLLLFLRLKHESKWWQIMLTGGVAGLAIYLPPFLSWLSLILTALAITHAIKSNRGRLPVGWLIYFASFIVVLAPLILAAASHPAVLLSLFGVEDIASFSQMQHNLIAAVRALTWDGRLSPLLLPAVGLVNVVVIVMGLLGLLRTVATWRLQRSQLILLSSFLALTIIVISERPVVAYGYVLPVVYLLVARGLNQFMSEWFKRFPRNKSAHFGAGFALTSLIVLTALYNLQTFYIAWAKSDHVRAQFHKQLLK